MGGNDDARAPVSSLTIGAVIVTYNDLERALRVAGTYEAGAIRARVVNNASEPPAVPSVVCGHGNVGFGAAANIGAASLIADGPVDWLIVSNADVAVGAVEIDALKRALAAVGPDVAVASVCLLEHHGECVRVLDPTPRSMLLAAALGERRALRARWRHSWPKGAFLVVRAANFREVGGFDPQFFMYYEDVDLAKRLMASGSQEAHLPVKIRHEGAREAGCVPWHVGVAAGQSAVRFTRKHGDSMVVFVMAFLIRAGAGSVRLALRRRSIQPLVQAVGSACGVFLTLLRWDSDPLTRSRLCVVPLARRRALGVLPP
jgi:hypothetical protein